MPTGDVTWRHVTEDQERHNEQKQLCHGYRAPGVATGENTRGKELRALSPAACSPGFIRLQTEVGLWAADLSGSQAHVVLMLSLDLSRPMANWTATPWGSCWALKIGA